jgi:hypothetical protein
MGQHVDGIADVMRWRLAQLIQAQQPVTVRRGDGL